MASDQIDLGFPKVIPPDHALVRAPPRQSRPRETKKTVVDAEVVTATADKVADAVVHVETTVKVNPIIVPPTKAELTPAPAPAQRTLPTPKQYIDAFSDKLTLIAASCDVHLKFDEHGACREARVKERVLWWSRKRTWLALIGIGVLAIAGAGLQWGPWVKAAFSPPPVVKPRLKSEPYGPPVPQHLLRRRQTKREPKPPPSVFEQIFGK